MRASLGEDRDRRGEVSTVPKRAVAGRSALQAGTCTTSAGSALVTIDVTAVDRLCRPLSASTTLRTLLGWRARAFQLAWLLRPSHTLTAAPRGLLLIAFPYCLFRSYYDRVSNAALLFLVLDHASIAVYSMHDRNSLNNLCRSASERASAPLRRTTHVPCRRTFLATTLLTQPPVCL